MLLTHAQQDGRVYHRSHESFPHCHLSIFDAVFELFCCCLSHRIQSHNSTSFQHTDCYAYQSHSWPSPKPTDFTGNRHPPSGNNHNKSLRQYHHITIHLSDKLSPLLLVPLPRHTHQQAQLLRPLHSRLAQRLPLLRRLGHDRILPQYTNKVLRPRLPGPGHV